jgi:arginine decarboxylase
VHISTEELKIAYRVKLVNSQLSRKEQHDYEQELLAGLTAYTYLEK